LIEVHGLHQMKVISSESVKEYTSNTASSKGPGDSPTLDLAPPAVRQRH